MGWLSQPETIWWGWALTLLAALLASFVSYREFSRNKHYAHQRFAELHERHADIRLGLETVLNEAGARSAGEQRTTVMGKALDREVEKLRSKVPDYDIAPFYEDPLYRLTSTRLNLLEAALTLQKLVDARRKQQNLNQRTRSQHRALETYRSDYRSYRERPGSYDLSGFLETESLVRELESLRERARQNEDYIEQLSERVESRLEMSQKHYEPKTEEALRALDDSSWIDFLAYQAERKDWDYVRERVPELFDDSEDASERRAAGSGSAPGQTGSSSGSGR